MTTAQLPLVSPRIDIRELEDAWVIDAEVPGVAQDDLIIDIDHDELVIRGTVSADIEPDDLTIAHREWRRVDYERRVSLSRDVDRDHIDARLRDGLLQVRLPKKADAQPRRISISS